VSVRQLTYVIATRNGVDYGGITDTTNWADHTPKEKVVVNCHFPTNKQEHLGSPSAAMERPKLLPSEGYSVPGMVAAQVH
jgi:hypothetical protein